MSFSCFICFKCIRILGKVKIYITTSEQKQAVYNESDPKPNLGVFRPPSSWFWITVTVYCFNLILTFPKIRIEYIWNIWNSRTGPHKFRNTYWNSVSTGRNHQIKNNVWAHSKNIFFLLQVRSKTHFKIFFCFYRSDPKRIEVKYNNILQGHSQNGIANQRKVPEKGSIGQGLKYVSNEVPTFVNSNNSVN